MKSRRHQYAYRSNASKLHKAVGEVLRNDPRFMSYHSYQEYHVKKVNPNFPSHREKFDWVIPSLYLVIECHGKQHYYVTDFGGDGDPTAAFEALQERDRAKEQAARDMNWTYIVIKYDEKVSGDLIWDRFTSSQPDSPVVKREKKPSSWQPRKPQRRYNKDAARAYRKEQYRRQKAWLAERKHHAD